MKHLNKFFGIIAVAAIIMASVTACDTGGGGDPTNGNPVGDPSGDPADDPSGNRGTLRYETVPYNGRSGNRAADGDDGEKKLVFSAFDDESYYYVFLLGHVNKVPLAYRPAIYYNGKTNISIGYSSSNLTEESIASSIEEAYENSVTESRSFTWEAGIEVGVEAGPDVAKFSAKVSASVGGTLGTDTTNSRSTANTQEVARSKASEITDEISATIGENGEKEGLYRYSLFATTDVYYVLITNKAKTTKTKSYVALCARPQTYWGLDYEPEMDGSFAKTAPGELLGIPDVVLSELPDPPAANDVQEVPPESAAEPTADKKGGTYESKVTVTLESKTPGAVIYYTLGGAVPSTTDTKYTAPIVITETTTLKAIAVASNLIASEVMSEAYTITLPPLQTEWSVAIAGDRHTVKDSASYTETLNMENAPSFTNYDPARLKGEGYTHIKIRGEFRLYPDDYGTITVTISGANGTQWHSEGYETGHETRHNEWSTEDFSKEIPIDDFTTRFTVKYSVSGANTDNHTIDSRSFTFTAVKKNY